MLRLHSWLGAAFGILLAVLSLTGAPLVFKPEIEQLMSPHLPLAVAGEPLAVDVIVAQVQILRPGARLRSVIYPADAYGRRDWTQPWRLSVASAAGGEIVWLDPFTGREIPRPDIDLGQFLRDIHVRLYLTEPKWLRDIVQVFVGLLGVAMLVSAVTGLMFSKHLLRDMLRWQPGRSRRARLGAWHKLAGLWLLAFHLVIAISGAAVSTIVLPSAIRQHFGAPPAPLPPYDDSIRTISFARIEAIAAEALPGAAPLWLSMPTRAGDAVRVSLAPASSWLRHGDDRIAIDPANGDLRSRTAIAADTWYWRLYSLMWPLHFGYFAGLGSRIAYAVLGLAPALLAVTGLLIWLGRKRRL